MDDYSRRFRELDRLVLISLLTAVSSHPQKAASTILQRFPSFQHATRGDHQILAEIIGDSGASLLRTIPKAVASLTRETAMNNPTYILNLEAAKAHFSALLNGRRNEAFVVLYFNGKNRLLDEDLWEGTIDKISIYPREIARRAILLDASAILIAHNHPSGDPTPSVKDLTFTLSLQGALDALDVILLDHLIFGEGEPYSLRDNSDI